ncbi:MULTISPECIES: DUF2474 domain-containing protein [unclassified Methylobacterium]|nr:MULTISPECIES: DUF2474 domain-containing protein [unclassified Methylobacterium]
MVDGSSPGGPPPLWRRLLWFAAIWAASIVALGIVAFGLRTWLKAG